MFGGHRLNGFEVIQLFIGGLKSTLRPLTPWPESGVKIK